MFSVNYDCNKKNGEPKKNFHTINSVRQILKEQHSSRPGPLELKAPDSKCNNIRKDVANPAPEVCDCFFRSVSHPSSATPSSPYTIGRCCMGILPV